MKKIIPFLLISVLLSSMLLPQTVDAKILTNTEQTETLNISLMTGLCTVMQKINIEGKVNMDTIKIPIGYERIGDPLIKPDLTILFGAYTSNNYPFVATPLITKTIKWYDLENGYISEIILNIGQTLSNITYAIVFHIPWAFDIADASFHDGIYYKLGVGKNVISGTLVEEKIVSGSSYLRTEEENDLVMTIKYTTDGGSGGLGFGFDNENTDMTTVIAVLGVVGVGGYFVSRRLKK